MNEFVSGVDFKVIVSFQTNPPHPQTFHNTRSRKEHNSSDVSFLCLGWEHFFHFFSWLLTLKNLSSLPPTSSPPLHLYVPDLLSLLPYLTASIFLFSYFVFILSPPKGFEAFTSLFVLYWNISYFFTIISVSATVNIQDLFLLLPAGCYIQLCEWIDDWMNEFKQIKIEINKQNNL